MAARRGNNEGSIYRRSRGGWGAQILLPDGRRRTFSGATREAVRRQLAAALRERDAGTLSDARGLKVGEYLDRWLADVARPNIRYLTYSGYEVNVRLHLKPVLGDIPLERLTPMHVQALLNAKQSAGMSPKSVRYIRGTLRTALNQAIRWGLISKNAAALTQPPRARQFEIRPLDRYEAIRFLSSVKGDRLEALYTVALSLGLRQAEALGLQWQYVNLRDGVLTVTKQLQRPNRRWELVDLKTELSRRTLALPLVVAEQLQMHRTRQLEERQRAGERWQESDLVFTSVRGRPLWGSTVNREFQKHLEVAGLPQRRFHDLRHSCATLLLVQGVSPRVVMEILGHSEIGMTMNTYSHVVPELRREAASRMESILRGEQRDQELER